jgi:hypothetical protein
MDAGVTSRMDLLIFDSFRLHIYTIDEAPMLRINVTGGTSDQQLRRRGEQRTLDAIKLWRNDEEIEFRYLPGNNGVDVTLEGGARLLKAKTLLLPGIKTIFTTLAAN